MGRPENPIDPQDGPVQRFAHELRTLRDEAGAPAYRVMARQAGYSAATLSQAAAGERLPTLPVLLAYVRACDGDTDDWQHRWEEADRELARIPRPEQDDTDPPYRGLARFEPGDAELFFGRDEMVSQLAELARGHRVSALVGASGSGKSSLLRAGLIPRLREPGDQGGRAPAAVRILTPGPRPLAHAERLEPAPGPGDTWLLVDQFEELFTLCADPGERAAFLQRLLTARDESRRLRVVLAVRADFFARCAEHGALAAALKEATLLVGPMGGDQLRAAIVRPATAHGLIVERELTARIIEEVEDEPGALPLMSHALMETWRRRKGRALTIQAYEAAGGLRGAIARTAEEAYQQLTPAQATLARRILLRLVAPGNGTQDTHHPTPRTEFETAGTTAGADGEAVLNRLARARLLTLDDETVSLAHEALLTAWPRLHRWIDEDRERLRLHRQLTHDATAWRELDGCPGSLYRGTRLTRAEEAFDAAERSALNPLEQAFLDAGIAARQAEYDQAARAARRAHRLSTALPILCVLAVMAGLVAWQQHRDRDDQHSEAEARRIASVAASLRATDPVRAMRLSVAAWRLAETPETRGAVLAALSQRERDAMPLPDGVEAAETQLSGDGRTLVSLVKGRLRRWDVPSHRELPAHPASPARTPVLTLDAVTRDGRTTATTDGETVRVHGGAGGRGEVRVPSASAASVFSASGKTLLNGDDTVRLWDWRHRRLLFRRTLPQRDGEMFAMAVSPDDRYVAVCSPHFPLAMWDVAGKRRAPLPRALSRRHLCQSESLEFAPDGRGLLFRQDGREAEVRDIASGRTRWRIKHAGLTGTVLSGDGTVLAGQDSDEILVWRTDRPDSPVLRYPISNEDVQQLRIDTGHRVIRYLGGGAIRTLSFAHPIPAGRDSALLQAAQFSPDAGHLATAHDDKGTTRFRLLNVRDGSLSAEPPAVRCAPPEPGPDPEGEGSGCDPDPFLAFGPDGRRLAYGAPLTAGGPLHLWDARAHRRIRIPRAVQGDSGPSVLSGLFSANGDSVLVADRTDTSIRVWNLRGNTVRTIRRITGRLLAAHPDGRHVAVVAGSADPARLVDLRTRRLLPHPLTAEGATAVAFSPDGRLLAAGDTAGRVTVWDGRARRQLGQLPAADGDTPSGGPEAVTALAFSPDGKTLATAGDQGTVRLWDTASHQPLGGPLPTAPDDPVLALAFTPDGRALRTAARHTPVQTHPLAPARATRTLCDRADGGLSPSEWRSYLPDIDYRTTC
ncbi:nSTAND1 domain-containing NTPase [Streptomyces sp. NPDC002446]